jgi:hypothetical protein
MALLDCGQLIIGDISLASEITISNNIDPVLVSAGIDLNTSTLIRFSNGTLDMGPRALNLNCDSIATINGKMDVSDNASELTFLNSSAIALPAGLFSGAIHRLAVAGTGGITLGDSTTVTGSLSLSGGDLAIGNNTLALNGIIQDISYSNTLRGGSSSKLRIGGNGATSIGILRFAAGTRSLHTLSINRTGATGNNPVVSLGNDMTISNSLVLTNGKMALDSHSLYFTGSSLSGGNAGSYIKVSGPGALRRPGASIALFPIGTDSYLPVTLNCSSCGSTDFTARVINGVTDESNTTITSDVVAATWSVVSSGNQAADLTFGWPASAELSMPHTGIVLGTRATNLSTWTRIGSNLTVSGSDPYSVSQAGFSFSGSAMAMFGVGGAPSPLPVHIMNIAADCRQVSWQSGNESQGTLYNVQASVNGSEWTVLGSIKGAGDQSGINSYSFNLSDKAKGMMFFRIVSNSVDGVDVSRIIKSGCSQYETKYVVYPNPVTNEFNINGLAEGAIVRMYNSTGSLVYETVYDGSNSMVNMDDMKPGLYILQINDETFSLMKSH